MTHIYTKVLIKRIVLSVIIQLCCVLVNSQNLAPNPSFELNYACPDSIGKLELVKDWWSPFGRPVYFHACNNYKTNYRRIVPPGQKAYNEEPVIANSGVGYVGIYMSVISVLSHHDYLMCKLNSPLKKDSVYDVEMMVRLGDVWKFIDYIGMFFRTINMKCQSDKPLNLTALITTLILPKL